MAHKRIRIETLDGEGRKFSVALEGRITREKLRQLIELVELMSGPEEDNEVQSIPNRFYEPALEWSKFDKVEFIARTRLDSDGFSSADVRECFEEFFRTSISLSVVSTYLSRLCDREVLSRSVNGGQVRYRLVQRSEKLPTFGFVR